MKILNSIWTWIFRQYQSRITPGDVVQYENSLVGVVHTILNTDIVYADEDDSATLYSLPYVDSENVDDVSFLIFRHENEEGEFYSSFDLSEVSISKPRYQ